MGSGRASSIRNLKIWSANILPLERFFYKRIRERKLFNFNLLGSFLRVLVFFVLILFIVFFL